MPGDCTDCTETRERVAEIHKAIVGTPTRSGLIARTERLEREAARNTKIIGAAVLAIAGYAFQTLTKGA